MNTRPRVILIREWEQQFSGSGCCGRLEGEFLGCGDESVFKERRATMEAMAPLYRSLREELGNSADLHVVDPRNFLSLVAMLTRDFWRFRIPLRDAFRTLSRLGVQGVIVNGRLVARGMWPTAKDVMEIVEESTRAVNRRPPFPRRQLPSQIRR